MLGLAEPHSDLDIHLLDALGTVILMVGPNQNFQWSCHTSAEGMPRVKSNYQKLFGEIIGYKPTHKCTRIGRTTLGFECSLYRF